MATWNDRTLPYPLLAPWTDDYVNAEFTGVGTQCNTPEWKAH